MTYPILDATVQLTSHPALHNGYIDAVGHFGAVGDNSADDTTAVQNAITAAANGIVYFPPGTYKITSPIAFGSRTKILGSGDGTRFNYTGSGKAFAQSNPGTRIYNVMMADFTLIGTSSGTHGIEWDSVTDGTLRNVSVTGFTSGVGIRIHSPTAGYSVTNRLDDVIITSCTTGLQISGTACNAQRVTGGKISSCTSRGIEVSYANDNTFLGIDMEANGTAIYLTDPAVGATQWNRILACRFEGNTTDVNIATATVRLTQIAWPWSLGASGITLSDSGELTTILGDYTYPLKVAGNITATGAVQSTRSSVTLTDAATVTVDASAGDVFTVALTASRTIAMATNGTNNQIITFRIQNSSGGAMTTSWAAGYLLGGAWTDPASTKYRTISFRYISASANWWEIGRTAADV